MSSPPIYLIDGFVLLSAPSAEARSARLVGPGHTKRRINAADLAAIDKLADFLFTDAIAHAVPVTVFADNFDDVRQALQESRPPPATAPDHGDLSRPVRAPGLERRQFDGM